LPARPGAANLSAAWLVHLYTAAGTLAAFFGTVAVFDDRYRDAFLWMTAATLVDATDGILARLARVRELLPGFDGARLDDIVDYLTFVFLPVLLLYRSGALPGEWDASITSLVLLSSAYGFASGDAKTHDHFFTGFPSYWNIVALYLHAARTPPWFNAGLLVALSALVFVRVGFVYPSRTPTLRTVTVVLASIWALMIIGVIVLLPDPPRPLLLGSLFFPIYYIVLSLVLHGRRERRAGAARA
jgi:phosphatidylcholine synthase